MTFNLIDFVIWLFAVIVAITIHEAAHAWMSDKLGDPNPRLKGRLSLNPLSHYDPIGTSMLLITAFLRAINIPVFVFGWAKPVEVDIYNLKNPKRDSTLISLAGPLANILLCIFLSLILYLTKNPFSPFNLIAITIQTLIFVNISLAVFNLIPIHPLDGAKVLVGLLPEKDSQKVDLFLRRYGTILLLFLIFWPIKGSSPLSIIISPVINFLIKVFIPSNPIF